MTDAPDPMAEIKASFFVECEELLEALQDGLQLMENGESDAETINVVFRAVHSIKGGAGAFGLDPLVKFAHRFETVMDEVRSGRLQVHDAVLRVFFQAADHLSDLVRACRDETKVPQDRSAALLVDLDAFLSPETNAAPTAQDQEIAFEPMTLSLDLGAPLPTNDSASDPSASGAGLPALNLSDLPDDATASQGRFTIRFRPYADLYETGNEPHQILRALGDLGQASVECDVSQVPTLDLLASDTPYLTWVITLDTEANEEEIASVFEFVEGLCQLEIEQTDGVAAPEQPISEEGSSAPDTPPQPDISLTQSSPTPAPVPSAAEPLPPVEDSLDQPTAPPSKPPPGAAAAKSVVRVDLERIERLVNLVGELVINQAMLSQSLEKSGISPHSDAMEGLEEFQRLTRDIQDSVMMIRAQPVKSLFQRMSRIVREASGAVGKNVRLVTTGENTEVDKTVIERLADPLTHMVRNAVDHGLESTQDRLAAGKPAQGKVFLTAAHKAGRVVIEVTDDGGGINRAKVQQIAVEKGLIPADAQLADGDIDNLLFLPGFSTASEISDLSGRGVGMDVVRTEIQSLGGRVSITSTPGEGTCFSISLPLTLAVLDGMVIQVADETLVIPLGVVTETMTLERGEVEMMRPDQPVIRVRNAFVPLLDLGATLGYRHALSDFTETVALLVTQEDGSSIGFVIDGILDQRQVVIKGLHEGLYRAPGVAAATILGDGQIALIVDPAGIVEMAAHHTSHTPLPIGIPA